jgi:hypothetical protein
MVRWVREGTPPLPPTATAMVREGDLPLSLFGRSRSGLSLAWATLFRLAPGSAGLRRVHLHPTSYGTRHRFAPAKSADTVLKLLFGLDILCMPGLFTSVPAITRDADDVAG